MYYVMYHISLPQVGGPSQQQAAVYEEFARCLPGFLPSSPSPGTKDASYGKAEVRTVFRTKILYLFGIHTYYIYLTRDAIVLPVSTS